MRSIIIDPTTRTVVDAPFQAEDSYRHIKAAMNGAMITHAGTRNSGDLTDTLFVDDEGLLKPELVDYFCLPLFYPTPLAGRGVVVGIDEEGETVGCFTTAEEVKAAIRWLKKSEIDGGTWRHMATTTVSRQEPDGTVTVVDTFVIDRNHPDPEFPGKVAGAAGKAIGIE
jgi:hypothetical protein